MSDLLIRDIDDATKAALVRRAAQHDRSQQAEALALLREALLPKPRNWADMLREAAEEVGGMDFEPPARHAPRDSGDML